MARPRKTASGGGFGSMAEGKSANWHKKTLSTKRRKAAPAEEAPKRKRGRPAGSGTGKYTKTRNKDWAAYTSAITTHKKRGRKPGTKNKAKVEVEVAVKKRGRPRKVAEVAVVAPKKRGRPRKTVMAAPVAKKRGRPAKATKMAVGMKRGRGRPKGAKDKNPRKKRGIDLSHLIGRPVKAFKSTKLKKTGRSPAAKTMPKKTNVRTVVHRTPTVKIGSIKTKKSKRGMLKRA